MRLSTMLCAVVVGLTALAPTVDASSFDDIDKSASERIDSRNPNAERECIEKTMGVVIEIEGQKFCVKKCRCCGSPVSPPRSWSGRWLSGFWTRKECVARKYGYWACDVPNIARDVCAERPKTLPGDATAPKTTPGT